MPRPTLYHTPEEKRAAAAARAKRWRERNPEAHKAAKQRYHEKNPQARVEQHRSYYERNTEAELARSAAWRTANPERRKELDRAAYERSPEAHWARLEQWKAENPERVAAYRREVSSRQKKKHRAKHTALQNARNARKKQATVVWSDKATIEEFYELARLRTSLTGIPWEVDHIVPLTSDLVCGLHCEANLQVIPMVSNISKWNAWWPDMPDATPDCVTFAERPSLYLIPPAGPARFLPTSRTLPPALASTPATAAHPVPAHTLQPLDEPAFA